MNDLTAAHRTLPLGSVILVKNLDNGKVVKVRVNDRGPFKGKRILDLSYAAAKRLDMVGDGEARVGIKVLGAGSRDYASNDDLSDDEASGLVDNEPFVPLRKKPR
jgi:rare lipoprotein A